MSQARPLLAGGCIAAALMLAAPATAQVLIVRSQGPSAPQFRPGMVIPKDRPVTLQAGDRVTVLDGRGTREFKGPGQFNGRPAARRTRSALMAIFQRNAGRRTQVASVRSVTPGYLGRPESLWDLDILSGGSFCIAEGERVSLWRPGEGSRITLTITRQSNNSARRVPWPARQTLAWPEDLPQTDGEKYTVTAGGSLRASVTWRAIDPPGRKLERLAAQLDERGCSSQLETLQRALGD